MSLNNSQLHGFAFAGTIVLLGGLFGGTLYLTQASSSEPHIPPLQEMMTIEASLARKAEKKRQPQKEVQPPEPTAKPQGVSRDENAKPPEKPKDDEKKPRKDDKLPDINSFRRNVDDEAPTGKPVTEAGQFDGSEIGFAPINAGNPYWQQLVAEFHQVWEIPEVSKVSGAAVGCFHIAPDGKIPGVKFETPSGDDLLDDSVQRALKATQKARNDKPQPVPTEQLGVIKKWVCFRFNPNP